MPCFFGGGDNICLVFFSDDGGCGGMWRRVWRDVEGFGGMWRGVEGIWTRTPSLYLLLFKLVDKNEELFDENGV